LNVISRKTLETAANDKKYAEIATDLDAWYKAARTAKWEDLLDVRRPYPKAEAVRVGDESYTVFNIRHNRFRLVVKIVYPSTVFVKYVLTHREYDRDEWKEALKAEQRIRRKK
jgi:mRNA interferase HigB